MNSCFSLLCLFANLWSSPSAYAEQVYYNVSPSAAVAVYRAYIEHTYPWTVEERRTLRGVSIWALLLGSAQCKDVVEHWSTKTPPFYLTICLKKWGGFTYPEDSRIVVGSFDPMDWLHEYYHIVYPTWSEEQVEDAARRTLNEPLPRD